MPFAPQGVATLTGGMEGDAKIAVVQYTGNNTGDATTQTVTGVGFEPELIIIIVDEALGASSGILYVWAANSTAANVYGMVFGAGAWGAIAGTDKIEPTSDGFKLNKTEANGNGYKYTAICFALT